MSFDKMNFTGRPVQRADRFRPTTAGIRGGNKVACRGKINLQQKKCQTLKQEREVGQL